jgi:transcriptional regulator of PTS gene
VGEPCSANLESYLNHPNQELREYVSKCSFDLAEVTNNAILILAPDKLVLFGDIFEHDSIVSLFTEQLVEINSTLPEQFCVKSTFRKKKKYIGSTAIAVENFLLS